MLLTVPDVLSLVRSNFESLSGMRPSDTSDRCCRDERTGECAYETVDPMSRKYETRLGWVILKYEQSTAKRREVTRVLKGKRVLMT